jgi:alkylation response protein AidB-like acyl-CoA dehydrogenase
MEFAFTDEQQMIRDTAEAFLAEVSTSEAVRQAMVTDQGYDSELWQRICTELYWQAIHIPEAYGGLGLGYVELAAMLEQMGRYLLCAPFFSTVCLGANALLVAGSEAQKAEFLPKICEGMTATLAYTGPQASRLGGQWGAEAVSATAVRAGEDFILNGTLRYVPDGASAQLLVVAARAEGSCAEAGISLFVLPADQLGIARTLLPTMDQTRKQGEITLTDVRVRASALMGEEGRAWPQLEAIIDLANIALAAEQMGGAQQLMDMTVDYTQERQQFNRAIASFQAIKHTAADMMTRVEVARSGVYYAACVADEHLQQTQLAGELAEAASVAKSYCADSYFQNASDALQLHGGVGFTWEYDVHLYFKRAKASEHFLGNGDYHRERLAKLLLDNTLADAERVKP